MSPLVALVRHSEIAGGLPLSVEKRPHARCIENRIQQDSCALLFEKVGSVGDRVVTFGAREGHELRGLPLPMEYAAGAGTPSLSRRTAGPVLGFGRSVPLHS
jgi:hypothetical protein